MKQAMSVQQLLLRSGGGVQIVRRVGFDVKSVVRMFIIGSDIPTVQSDHSSSGHINKPRSMLFRELAAWVKPRGARRSGRCRQNRVRGDDSRALESQRL